MARIPTVLTTFGDPPALIIINLEDYNPELRGPQLVLNPGQEDERIMVSTPLDSEPELSAEIDQGSLESEAAVTVSPSKDLTPVTNSPTSAESLSRARAKDRIQRHRSGRRR